MNETAREGLGLARDLLREAQLILDGRGHLARRHRTRAAALIARTGLERAIDAQLLTAGMDLGKASMRVKLICLTTGGPTYTTAWAFAWAGLSSACHQHAYELSPSPAQVQHLIEQIDAAHTFGEPT